MTKNTRIALLEKELKNIKSRYKKKYGEAIFGVKVKSLKNIIILQGVVLSEKQKKEVFLAAREIIKDGNIENNIKVLGNSEDGLEIGWGIINTEVADMRAKFPDKKNIIVKFSASTSSSLGGRVSQAVRGEFVRILVKKGGWFLAQTRDMAIGWVRSSQIAISKWKIIKEEWLKNKRAKPEEMIKKRLAKNIQRKFLGFLKEYLNAPYLLGGMTREGVDCSGLTGKFYSDIFGIVLPRHSGDQALCGEKIELGGAHFGDLFFLRHRATKLAHIGVVVEKFKTPKAKYQAFDDILILNARRESGWAAIEELSDILKSYNLISIKRIIKGY